MKSNYLLVLLMIFFNFIYSMQTNDFGRWVHFGIKGGQPQGGVVCTPIMPEGDDYVLCTGDITGIRSSDNHGKRWKMLNNPVKTAYKNAFNFNNICIDYNSWLNENTGIVYYFCNLLPFFNLKRSLDGGRTWEGVSGPSIHNIDYRVTPMTVEPFTGKGYIATYDGTNCKLFYFTRTGDAIEHLMPGGTDSLIYDVAGVNENRAIITTKTGIYTAYFNNAYSLKRSISGGGFLYINPVYPNIVWAALTAEKTLLKSINGGDTFIAVKTDLPFTPGKIAVYGGDYSGGNARIIISRRDTSYENPYLYNGYTTDIIYSSDGGLTFNVSAMEACGTVNFPIEAAAGKVTQMAATPTADVDGTFYISRFGGLMISINGGQNFIWSVNGIYGLNTFDIALANNGEQIWAGHNDHGLFKSDAGLSGDGWYNLCYNNWRQLTESWNSKGMCVNIFLDLKNESNAYYVLSPDYWADGGSWYVEAISNSIRKQLFDYQDFDAVNQYGFSCTMDISERLEKNNLVFYAGLRQLTGDIEKGVIKIFYSNDEWNFEDRIAGLTGDGLRVYDVQSDPYGTLYARTGNGLYRAAVTNNWQNKIGISYANTYWCRRSLSFDKYDASKVYCGYFEKIYFSTNFGETFSLLMTMPKSPENSSLYIYANTILAENNTLYIGAKGYTAAYGAGGILVTNLGSSTDIKWLDRDGMPRESTDTRGLLDRHGRYLTSSLGSGLIRYEMIIDNEDIIDTKKMYYYSELNSFADSITADEDREFGYEVRNIGSSRHFTFNGSTGSEAHFNFKVPETGVYIVYARWNIVAGKIMKTNACYFLTEDGVEKAKKFYDQGSTSLAAQWNKLYAYTFNQDKSYKVELKHYYGTGTTVNADAIRIEKYDGTVIIDNEMSDTSKDCYFVQSGMPRVLHSTSPWTYSYGPQVNKTASSFQNKCDGELTPYAEWNFKVPVTGKYKVFAWWAKGPDWQKADVNYRIYYEGANVLCGAVNQQKNQAKWNPVNSSSFLFNEGVKYKVVLREADQTGDGKHLSADAIMLQLESLN